MIDQLTQPGKKEIIWTACLASVFALSMGFLTSRFNPLLLIGGLIVIVVSILIYRSPILGLLAITLFLPFERIGSYDVSGITIRPSQLLAVIVIAVWLIKGVVNRNLKTVANPIKIPLLVFLLINLLSLTNALNIERSLLVLCFITFTILFSYALPNLITSEAIIRKIVQILLITTALVCLFGVWQFFGDMIGLPTTLTGLREHYTKDVFGFPRIQSTALEPLYFANFLLLPLALIFSFLISQSTKIKNLWLLPLFILAGINLVLTVSRGGYLGVLVLLLTISLIYLKKVFRWKFIISLLVGIVVVWIFTLYALGFGDIFHWNFDTFVEHVSNAFSGPAYNERIETFEWAKQAWLYHPWIGIGPGQYGPYVSTHPYIEPKEGWKIVNNEFIELLAENGILGLAAFILVLVILIIRSIKALIRVKNSYLKALMTALLAALLGVIAQYQTFSILYIMHIWFIIGLMVAVQNIILIPRGDKTNDF